MATIYRAYCLKSGKFYVGQTRHDNWVTCYATRWGSASKRYKDGKRLNVWEKALLKHGREGFQFRNLMVNVSAGAIDSLERFFIQLYRSNDLKYGYNLESGGCENKIMSEQTLQIMRDAAPKYKWFHKSHGEVLDSLAGVGRLSGLAAGTFLRLKRGELKAHRGWVSLEPTPYKGSLGRLSIWRHENLGEFIGSAKALSLAHIKDKFSRANRSALGRVKTGKLPRHKGWFYVGEPTIEQEIQARIAWAKSPQSDSDLRKGKATRGPRAVK